MDLQYNEENTKLTDAMATNKEVLSPYIEHLNKVVTDEDYEALESSINLPTNHGLLEEVQRLTKEKVNPSLKYIFVIGIGGSNLGTKAIYDALVGHFDSTSPARKPKMIFVDTNNPRSLKNLKEFINTTVESLDEVLVNAISKSGGTTETLANTEYIMGALTEKFGLASHRLVITTDYESNFWNAAEEEGVARLVIPHTVGGRYSVLSAVGLFPLAAAGFDIKQLRLGAVIMREKCLSQDIETNPAALSASILLESMREGKSINDNFVFNPELESLAKWYRQLMGESVGKEKNIDGKTVHAGITPTVSVGSTDLHSVGQLYLGGPKDKITTFIYSGKPIEGVVVPQQRIFPNVVGMINGKSMDTIMEAIREGVQIAYNKNDLPYTEVVLDDISEKSLGEFLQFKMIEMMYLGKLMHVNPFDQPNVESYKIETKTLLDT